MTAAQLQELHALTIAAGLRECIIESRNNGRFTLQDLEKPMYWLDRRLKEVGRVTDKPRSKADMEAFFAHVNSAVDIVHSEDGVNFLRFITAVEGVVHDTWRAVPVEKKQAWQNLLDALAALHEAYDPDLEICAEVNAGLAMGERLGAISKMETVGNMEVAA